LAVVFIDLDDFKTVNDSRGHAAGDHVLQEVARRLLIAVRPTDTVARFGGDEFAVLLESVKDSAQAADAAARILNALEIPLEIDGKQVFPRASVGICLVDRTSKTPEAAELLRNADVAMYMAKRDSKGSYRVFEPTMHELVVERLELRAELQNAIEQGQLVLHYQPVVRLQEHDILGVEALLRWQHPTRGTIPPNQFIPLAEELTGLGVRLAMDDFGTGYSSLSYLSRFPVDILKMDRSFVGAGENVALQSAIIALGASLELEVVAEGIELPEQEQSLHDLG